MLFDQKAAVLAHNYSTRGWETFGAPYFASKLLQPLDYFQFHAKGINCEPNSGVIV
jgi:hypothetical protein